MIKVYLLYATFSLWMIVCQRAKKYLVLYSINFILKHKVFEFNDCIYLQTTGTAMGSRFAPSFANLYVGLFETLLIQNNHAWYKNIVLYRRYIDNLIFIWQGPEDDFKTFTSYLNDNNWGLTFTGSINSSSTDYLDITLFSNGETICTKNFFLKS